MLDFASVVFLFGAAFGVVAALRQVHKKGEDESFDRWVAVFFALAAIFIRLSEHG